MRGPAYSRDEWIILFEYFISHDTAEHDDSNPVLIDFARALGRDASSVDMSLRNIKAYYGNGAGLPKGSGKMKEVVDTYRSDIPALKKAAAEARRRLSGLPR